MKKLFVILCLVMFLGAIVAGCSGKSGIPPVPAPTGCENAWTYKIKGFPEYGPPAVRASLKLLGSFVPALKPDLKAGAIAAYKSTINNDLGPAIGMILSKIKPVRQYADVAVMFLEAAQVFIPDKVKLTPCDINIWASLFKNVAKDFGATEADF